MQNDHLDVIDMGKVAKFIHNVCVLINTVLTTLDSFAQGSLPSFVFMPEKASSAF